MAPAAPRDKWARVFRLVQEMPSVSKKLRVLVFAQESEGPCRRVDRTSMEKALEKEALGLWERVYDTYSGDLMGFRLKARKDDDSAMPSQPTPAAIVASEMERFGFATSGFSDARSHTARLTEMDRLARQKSGLPAEDQIERTVMKVLVWPKVGARRGDILRAWPRGAA